MWNRVVQAWTAKSPYIGVLNWSFHSACSILFTATRDMLQSDYLHWCVPNEYPWFSTYKKQFENVIDLRNSIYVNHVFHILGSSITYLHTFSNTVGF